MGSSTFREGGEVIPEPLCCDARLEPTTGQWVAEPRVEKKSCNICAASTCTTAAMLCPFLFAHDVLALYVSSSVCDKSDPQPLFVLCIEVYYRR